MGRRPSPSQVVVTVSSWPCLVGCVSDTHVPSRARALPPALAGLLNGVDLILHAGDLTDEAVLAELQLMAPVYAVAGNVDPPALAQRLPSALLVEVGPPAGGPGWRVGLIHGDTGVGSRTPQRARSAFRDPDVVVFGHSHQPLCAEQDGVLLLNPGSPTDHRFAPWPSCAVLVLPDPAEPGARPRGEIRRLPE